MRTVSCRWRIPDARTNSFTPFPRLRIEGWQSSEGKLLEFFSLNNTCNNRAVWSAKTKENPRALLCYEGEKERESVFFVKRQVDIQTGIAFLKVFHHAFLTVARQDCCIDADFFCWFDRCSICYQAPKSLHFWSDWLCYLYMSSLWHTKNVNVWSTLLRLLFHFSYTGSCKTKVKRFLCSNFRYLIDETYLFYFIVYIYQKSILLFS